MLLNYMKVGDGKNHLIILHGLFGMLDNWVTLGRKFAENHTVWLIDQRNHGKSPHDYLFNYTVLANDLMDFMDEHQISTAILLGHSMGGKVVMKFTDIHSDRVEKLIIADMAPRAYSRSHDGIIEAMQGLELNSFTNRNDADDALKLKISDFGTRQFLLKNLNREKNNGFSWKMGLDEIDANYESIIEEVPITQTFDRPVLVVKGAHSNYINANDVEQFELNYPFLDLVEIDAGHWVHSENPVQFFDACSAFLEG